MKKNCLELLIKYCKRTRLIGQFNTLTKGILCNMYDALAENKRIFHSFMFVNDEVLLFEYDIILNAELLESLTDIYGYLEKERKSKKIKPKYAEYTYECGVNGDELLVMVDNNIEANKRYFTIPLIAKNSHINISIRDIMIRTSKAISSSRTTHVYDISKEAFMVLRDSHSIEDFKVDFMGERVRIPLCKSFLFGLRSYPTSIELAISDTSIDELYQISIRIVKDEIEECHSCFLIK
jgi:hypothetical protein